MKAWRNIILRFGLVAIPISIAPAKENKARVEGHTYDRASGQKVNRAWMADGKVTEDTFTGYADAEGQVYDVAKPDLPGEPGITLQGCLQLGDIDPLFYDDAYAVWPGKGGADGLGLVASILRDSGALLVGEARFTDRPRSVVIRWSEALQGIALHTLTYSDKVRSAEAVKANADLAEPSAELLAQGNLLTEALPATWAPMQTDPMEGALLQALANAGATMQGAGAATPTANVLDALRSDPSLKGKGKGKPKGKASKKQGAVKA